MYHGGILEAPFRCSKRHSKMIKTEEGEETEETCWEVSFNVMQKKLTDIQQKVAG